jgi:hypothetical protein
MGFVLRSCQAKDCLRSIVAVALRRCPSAGPMEGDAVIDRAIPRDGCEMRNNLALTAKSLAAEGCWGNLPLEFVNLWLGRARPDDHGDAHHPGILPQGQSHRAFQHLLRHESELTTQSETGF